MADLLTEINSFTGALDLSFANPMGLALNVILSTIVGGIVILVVVGIIAKKFSEEFNPLHAFFLALVVSLINLFGIIPLLAGLVGTLPFAGVLIMLLPVIVWIVLVKLFFKDMSMLHALIIGVIGYVLSIYVIPMLVNVARGFLPF